jgi:pimeloyl-ACP methyl ester carboxylesterase
MHSYIIHPLRLFFGVTSRLMPSFATYMAERLFTRVPYSKRRDTENELLETAVKFTIPMQNGHQLAAYRWGSKNDPIILFVHGWTATATCFARFIDHFVSKGYQVIAYDGIAHGSSTGKRVALPIWADSVVEVNRHIGHVDTIVGHSLGSAAIIISLSLSLDTDRVVLLSPATNTKEIIGQFTNALSIPEAGNERLSRYLWKKYKHSASKYGENWESVFLSDFKVPTLIVHDKNDKEVDIENARWLARRWPLAQLIETERLGHRRILINMKVISLVSDFIHASSAEVRV